MRCEHKNWKIGKALLNEVVTFFDFRRSDVVDYKQGLTQNRVGEAKTVKVRKCVDCGVSRTS